MVEERKNVQVEAQKAAVGKLQEVAAGASAS
jgi:hypothetical protein